MKRRICVMTGTRAEYGLLKPVLESIRRHPKLELLVLVAGMHLSEEFGGTAGQVAQDGFKIDFKVEMDPKKDTPDAMAESVGVGIIGMTKAFRRKRPDATLVLGDRTEALAAAIASAYMNIPVGHIHGGDISMAGLDESARHAITKMSHIHFAASRQSRRRILRLGEDPRYVFLVGSPGLDSILRGRIPSWRELSAELGLDPAKPFLLMAQHPVTTQTSAAAAQIRETLAAVKSLSIDAVLIYPNSDSGGRAIIREIEKRRWSSLRAFKSLSHESYLGLLKHARVMVGNSSSGILEAPSFKLPVVNVGIRQQGRERSVNVLDAPHDRQAIRRAIEKALYDRRFLGRVRRASNPYGDGRAAERIAVILSRIELGPGMLQKQISY